MRGERGFALVITLIVTALLVALLVEFVNEVYVDTSHSHNFVASQQAGILAQSGIDGGIKLLQFSNSLKQGTPYSSLHDTWAKVPPYDAGVGSVTLSIEEESGKLNLNIATFPNGNANPYTDIAKSLLKQLKEEPELTDVLMDWVDENDLPQPNGAETSYYSTLKSPYAAKNQRLETVEELLLLKGFTPLMLAKLRSFVTVYGANNDAETATLININTAPRELLASLDPTVKDVLIDQILDYRRKKPIKGPTDLHEIAGISAISPLFESRITYSGSVYRIRSEGRVGESVSVAEAVVRMGPQPTVLYWREY